MKELIQVTLHSTDPSAVFATRNTIKMLGGDLVEKDGLYFVTGDARASEYIEWAALRQGYVLPGPGRSVDKIRTAPPQDLTRQVIAALEESGYEARSNGRWVREAGCHVFIADNGEDPIEVLKRVWSFTIIKTPSPEHEETSMLKRSRYSATIMVQREDMAATPRVIIQSVEHRLLLALLRLVGE